MHIPVPRTSPMGPSAGPAIGAIGAIGASGAAPVVAGAAAYGGGAGAGGGATAGSGADAAGSLVSVMTRSSSRCDRHSRLGPLARPQRANRPNSRVWYAPPLTLPDRDNGAMESFETARATYAA